MTHGASNGQGDSMSRIQVDSFDWSRWNPMCSPKKLSGIVFLPHQSQLKYVNRFLCNMCRCGIQCAIPKRCQKSCSSPHSSHHSYNMLKRFLSTMCRCRILCDIPKRLQKSCIYHTNHCGIFKCLLKWLAKKDAQSHWLQAMRRKLP